MTYKFLTLIFSVFVTTSVANASNIEGTHNTEFQEQNFLASEVTSTLRVGDVILIDINCYICKIIKDETNSQFSHSGLVIGHNGNDFIIAQSLGKTETVTGSEFLSIARRNAPVKIIRPVELGRLYSENYREYVSRAKLLQYLFLNKYNGTPFDPQFLWNNKQNGKPLLYCAEMIVKLLNEVLTYKISPQPMSFIKNWDYWYEYYGKKDPPQGELGVSPGSLETDPLFKAVLEL